MTAAAKLRFDKTDLSLPFADLNNFFCSLLDDSERREPALFMRTPEGEVFIGWGGAAVATASGPDRFRELRDKTDRLLAAHTDATTVPPWCGGLSFFSSMEPAARENPWEDFPNALFFLPKAFVHGRVRDGMLTGTLLTESAAQDERFTAAGLRKSRPAPRGNMSIPEAQDDSEAEKFLWLQNFQEFSSQARAGHLQKVVLSRYRSFQFPETPDVGRVWSVFSGTDFPNAYVFGFAWQDSLFFGATPEPILLQEGLRVSVPAIAGTHPRGRSEREDKFFANKLLNSPKERSEHGYVVDFIRARLAELGGNLEPKRDPEVIKLKYIQHLFTKNEAYCEVDCHPLEILERLHPTPAMCGHPSLDALSFLARNESYERGLYASPLGFFSAKGNWARFVVGIRSALLRGMRLQVFAGAGLVDSSEADQEWLETEQKMQTIVRVFDRSQV